MFQCRRIHTGLLGFRDATGSVVHHTYVVDNNSTDDTFKKVRQWQKSNPNFPLSLLSETKNLALPQLETCL